MATDISSISVAAQDQVLAAIKTTQAAILDGVRTLTASAASIMPELPSIPGLDRLPSPAEGLAIGFDFAERLLATQRDFATQLLGVSAPVAAPAATKSKA